jgi:hypothetical protein
MQTVDDAAPTGKKNIRRLVLFLLFFDRCGIICNLQRQFMLDRMKLFRNNEAVTG